MPKHCCSGQVVVKPYVCLFVFEICKMETIALPALTVRLKGEPMSSLLHNRQSVNTAGCKCVLPAPLTSFPDSKGNRTRAWKIILVTLSIVIK